MDRRRDHRGRLDPNRVAGIDQGTGTESRRVTVLALRHLILTAAQLKI
jgi:hypothetical protein